MDYDPPTSTDTYLFNVYIGDTEMEHHSGYGAAGYTYWRQPRVSDDCDCPANLPDEYYLVFNDVHEFFMFCGRTGRYDYDEYGPGLGTGKQPPIGLREVYPNDVTDGIFLVGYTFFHTIP